MSRVFGFRMANEAEQLHLWLLFRYAMDHRMPVRVSYFKEKKDDQHRPVRTPGGAPIYVKITRIVEPHELTQTKAGHSLVKVVDRTPEDDKGPAYRSIRLDRVAFSWATSKVLAHVMAGQRYICPSLLDGKELQPRKRELTGA